jgi:predicted dehydrogenase
MKKIKVAVIGVGNLGQFHAEKYHTLEHTALCFVCDINQARCHEIAERYQSKAIYDFRKILDQVDAISIVTPAITHYGIAKLALEAGVHVLLEKPISETLSQANDLIQSAEEQGVILQVGHIEHFNPAVQKLKQMVNKPKLIEAVRAGPFQPRNLDVSVVLDLMIHDINIMHVLNKSPIREIQATGLAIISDQYDVANARFTFEDGGIAHLSASRISPKKERTLKVYEANQHIFVDCQEQTLFNYYKENLMETDMIEHVFDKRDILTAEIDAFIETIQLKQKPMVDGIAGRNALATALQVHKAMTESKKILV